MTFDQYGYLTPYEVIETDIVTFEEVFVKGFPSSSTRSTIFGEYSAYLDQLRQIIGGEFYQWIDGSFITQKTNPNDIDLVTFLNFEQIQQSERELNTLRKLRYEGKRYLDNYFVPTYPNEHPNFTFFEIDRLEWMHRFERDTRKKMKHTKGIIQLNF